MTDTQVATTDNRPPIVVLRSRLEARRGELKAALGDIPVDTFIRALMTSVQINPELLACSWSSIWTACLRACRDGLLPDGEQGVIVGFKSNAQWIPMYKGLVTRFRRSGQFRWIAADIVREGEEFIHYRDETGEHFKHVPGDAAGSIVKVYACALTKDGGFFVSVLSMAEANKIRAISRATRDDSPWSKWPEEMLRKTALRRLVKLLPSARDIIGDEDEQLEPPAAIQSIEPRRPGAAAALEQFASPAASHVSAGGEGGGGEQAAHSEAGTPDESAAQDHQDTPTEKPAAAAESKPPPKGKGLL
jgi:recombination protein RecT